jgi:flagellar biosynthesis chaperone FliJ
MSKKDEVPAQAPKSFSQIATSLAQAADVLRRESNRMRQMEAAAVAFDEAVVLIRQVEAMQTALPELQSRVAAAREELTKTRLEIEAARKQDTEDHQAACRDIALAKRTAGELLAAAKVDVKAAQDAVLVETDSKAAAIIAKAHAQAAEVAEDVKRAKDEHNRIEAIIEDRAQVLAQIEAKLAKTKATILEFAGS